MSTHISQTQRRVDLNKTPFQQAMDAELSNRREEMTSALADLNRVKQHSGRGNLQASINGYERVYQRIERIAKQLFEMTGLESVVPAYDPPKGAGQGETVKIGAPDPFAAPPKMMPAKKIPADIPCGTARWYTIQGQTPPEGCPP